MGTVAVQIIEQGESELKHITLLRKVIMGRRSGQAWFEGSNWRLNIPFDHGVLLLENNVSETLGRVLREPVLRFSWREDLFQADDMAIPIMPRSAFSQTLAALDLPEDRVANYLQMFSRFPAVKVRLTPVFRFDLEYQELFQELFQMAMTAGGAHLSEYFADSAGGEGLRKRSNVLLVLYCLGDLLPVPKQDEAGASSHGPAVSMATAADKANVVSRILMRLRGA